MLRARSLLALASLACSASAQNINPGPAIWREVTGIENTVVGYDAKFTRPHVPSYRTTADGRIAVNVKGVPYITLLIPEKLDASSDSLLHQPASAFTMSWGEEVAGSYVPEGVYLGGSKSNAEAIYAGGSGRRVKHGCLWDDGPPTYEGDRDVYELKIVVITETNPLDESIQLFTTRVRVEVSSPKTLDAEIASVTVVDGTSTIAGPIYNDTGDPTLTRTFGGRGFEPTIAGDGRLIVFRVGSDDLLTAGVWPFVDQGADIVYSYYEGGDTADPTGWTDVYPVSHAYHDSRINTKFGFAMYPLRDPEGRELPDWEDLGATYPWIDRDANNLFFTTIRAILHTVETDPMSGRYPLADWIDDPHPAYGDEEDDLTRGPAFAGLWSRGKMVVVDNLTHDMDYAIGRNDALPTAPDPGTGPQQRMVQLFTDGGDDAGWLRLGYGRSNHDQALPKGENANTTILESIENFFNYKSSVVPIAPRDVVWFQQNGKHTDQLIFDDYLDPDALIVASMVGLVALPADLSGQGLNDLEYYDGWDVQNEAWFGPQAPPIRLQNAATAHHRWTLPTYGELVHTGNGRLEPTAAGGIHGRGLWLDDGIGLRFDVPAQSAFEDTYVGLFVDCRFDDDATDRMLLDFPDGTSLRLRGRSRFVFHDGVEPVHYIDVPDSFTHSDGDHPSPYEFLPNKGWAHIALHIEDEGRSITLALDGLPLGRWARPSGVPIFQVDGGDFTVGDPKGGPTFVGWIDELKVILRGIDPETACNHAGGTLVGVDGTPAGSWARGFAESFPTWAHDSISFELRARGEDAHELYANFHDYDEDDAVYEGRMPQGAVSLADAIHFPEGPLFYDRERPDTSTNVFCLSCHNDGEQAGLTLGALTFAGGVLAEDDLRRQPMQPPAEIGGYVPMHFADVGDDPLPENEITPLPGELTKMDRLVLPEHGAAPSSQIGSVFVVEATTGKPLLELGSSGTTEVDFATFSADEVTLQVNLDSAQDSVGFDWDGGSEPTVDYAPYTLFKTLADPFAGMVLTPGPHTLGVTPEGGLGAIYSLNVPGGARPIANYRDEFVPGSPPRDWFYGWIQPTAGATIRTLVWNPDIEAYTLTGTETSGLSLSAAGGTTSPGSSAGLLDNQFVMAGYRFHEAGFAGALASGVTGANVGATLVLQNSSGLTVVPIPTLAPPQVQPGDVLWIAMRSTVPGNSYPFMLDFDVWYLELP